MVLADLLKPTPISGADALRRRRQDERCCKVQNRTTLVEGWQGGAVAGPVQWLWLVAYCYEA